MQEKNLEFNFRFLFYKKKINFRGEKKTDLIFQLQMYRFMKQ